MASLISVSGLSKSFASRPLFTNINFGVNEGERVGLIGPNGAGKSTLLAILAGKQDSDDGEIATQRGLRLGFLEQVPVFKKGATILSTILEGALHPDDGAAITLAYELISKLSLDGSSQGNTNLNPESEISKLSGGWKKRVALARELCREPDLLLLDEPTNHLDVESILWLEDFVSRGRFATLTVTHDRLFLQRVATRILELDRRNPGGLLSINGHYDHYLEAKQILMEGQEKQETALKNTLRREQEWLRAGTPARTTKQHARIERAGNLAKEVSELEYRNTVRTAGLEFISDGAHPKKMIEAKGISKSINGHPLFKNLNVLLSPGSRLGLLGPNGCGKSTLIRILLGEQKPDAGTVFKSDHLEVAYFEQNRDSLDPQVSVAKSLSPHGDQVIYRGSPVHVRGYLDRFMFSQMQMNMPVGRLSGGEQSRLLLARLMLQDANILVLDEPTNDLDLATLALLEDCLTEFAGVVLLVTHDRFFLDRVATRILAFHPQGQGKTDYFETLGQWEDWHREACVEKPAPVVEVVKSSAKKTKLSYKEQREFDGMEEMIRKLEQEIEALSSQLQLPATASNSSQVLEITSRMGSLQDKIDALYNRWAELEKKKG